MSCAKLTGNYGLAAVTAALDPPGLVLNLMCIIGFAQILWHNSESSTSNISIKSNMFKYLLVKAACDFFIFVSHTVYLLYLCDESCHLYANPAFTNWSIYLNLYMVQILFLLSSLMEVAATLDCYCTITSRFQFALKTNSFFIITVCSSLLAVGLESFIALAYVTAKRVVRKPGGENYTEYYLSVTQFGTSSTSKWLDLSQSLFRDLFLGSVLIVINGLILVEIRNATKNRMRLSAGNLGAVTDSVRESLKAEKRKAIMIGLTGVNYILGHVGYIIVSFVFRVLPSVAYSNLNGWSCYLLVAFTVYYASFATPLLFYYFFNKHFKRFLIKDLIFVCSPLISLFGIKIAQDGEQTQAQSRRTTQMNAVQHTA